MEFHKIWEEQCRATHMIRQHRSTRVRLVTCAKGVDGSRRTSARRQRSYRTTGSSRLPERRAVEIMYHTGPPWSPSQSGHDALILRRPDRARSGTGSSGHPQMQRRALAHIFLVGW